MAQVTPQTDNRRKWSNAILKASKAFESFRDSGDRVVKQYRIEEKSITHQEKYNILYSNTETIKPSLYSSTPKPEVQADDRDSGDDNALAATMLIEHALAYNLKEQDFDYTLKGVVEDYLLPGMGQVWLRYEPTFAKGEDGAQTNDIDCEKCVVDYVHWKDFLTHKCRRWTEVKWVARRSYMTKLEIARRFGAEKASKISFSSTTEKTQSGSDETLDDNQAAVWEIWDKVSGNRIMFCENYKDDLLEVIPDPLKLEGFFPCPRPVMAITTTNTIIPRPFYSQYQAQADELNDITSRIRRLVDALRVVGIYDASEPALKEIITGKGNKMVPVQNWATVSEKGGLRGSVDFMSIAEISNALMQLYDARDRVKSEIYEITGWSDIIRGVSKASETLGAQRIKTDWAGSRLKDLQKEIERFCRDIMRMMGEIIVEHFQPESLAVIAGVKFDNPDPNVKAQLVQQFKDIIGILKDDRKRCALIDIETDSTLMPDENSDKAERMEFLGAAGAFLQQAVPAMQADPRMGPLLAEILMFTIRTFRSSRSLEKTFKAFSDQLKAQGAAPPQPKPGEQKPDPAQGQLQVEQLRQQGKQQEIAATGQMHQAELQQKAQDTSVKLDFEHRKEENRHNEKMLELQVRMKEAENHQDLGIAKVQLDATGQRMEDHHRAMDRHVDTENRREDRVAGDTKEDGY